MKFHFLKIWPVTCKNKAKSPEKKEVPGLIIRKSKSYQQYFRLLSIMISGTY